MSNSCLPPPDLLTPWVPKIALISGTSVPFMLDSQDIQIDSLRAFEKPLEALNAAATSATLSPRSFDFLVLIMPILILHKVTYPRLLKSIFILLENKYSVHMKRVHASDYGIPQNRDAFILLTSPVCAASPWGDKSVSITTVQNSIQDLRFANPRMRNSEGCGFVCNYDPHASDRNRADAAPHSMYNHETGFSPGSDGPVDLNSTAEISQRYRFNLGHPGKLSRRRTVIHYLFANSTTRSRGPPYRQGAGENSGIS
jgi:hypothetical protein